MYSVGGSLQRRTTNQHDPSPTTSRGNHLINHNSKLVNVRNPFILDGDESEDDHSEFQPLIPHSPIRYGHTPEEKTGSGFVGGGQQYPITTPTRHPTRGTRITSQYQQNISRGNYGKNTHPTLSHSPTHVFPEIVPNSPLVSQHLNTTPTTGFIPCSSLRHQVDGGTCSEFGTENDVESDQSTSDFPDFPHDNRHNSPNLQPTSRSSSNTYSPSYYPYGLRSFVSSDDEIMNKIRVEMMARNNASVKAIPFIYHLPIIVLVLTLICVLYIASQAASINSQIQEHYEMLLKIERRGYVQKHHNLAETNLLPNFTHNDVIGDNHNRKYICGKVGEGDSNENKIQDDDNLLKPGSNNPNHLEKDFGESGELDGVGVGGNTETLTRTKHLHHHSHHHKDNKHDPPVANPNSAKSSSHPIQMTASTTTATGLKGQNSEDNGQNGDKDQQDPPSRPSQQPTKRNRLNKFKKKSRHTKDKIGDSDGLEGEGSRGEENGSKITTIKTTSDSQIGQIDNSQVDQSQLKPQDPLDIKILSTDSVNTDGANLVGIEFMGDDSDLDETRHIIDNDASPQHPIIDNNNPPQPIIIDNYGQNQPQDFYGLSSQHLFTDNDDGDGIETNEEDALGNNDDENDQNGGTNGQHYDQNGQHSDQTRLSTTSFDLSPPYSEDHYSDEFDMYYYDDNTIMYGPWFEDDDIMSGSWLENDNNDTPIYGPWLKDDNQTDNDNDNATYGPWLEGDDRYERAGFEAGFRLRMAQIAPNGPENDDNDKDDLIESQSQGGFYYFIGGGDGEMNGPWLPDGDGEMNGPWLPAEWNGDEALQPCWYDPSDGDEEFEPCWYEAGDGDLILKNEHFGPDFDDFELFWYESDGNFVEPGVHDPNMDDFEPCWYDQTENGDDMPCWYDPDANDNDKGDTPCWPDVTNQTDNVGNDDAMPCFENQSNSLGDEDDEGLGPCWYRYDQSQDQDGLTMSDPTAIPSNNTNNTIAIAPNDTLPDPTFAPIIGSTDFRHNTTDTRHVATNPAPVETGILDDLNQLKIGIDDTNNTNSQHPLQPNLTPTIPIINSSLSTIKST